jgi:hypothetical protein
MLHHVKQMYDLASKARDLTRQLQETLTKFDEMSKKYPEGNYLYDEDICTLGDLEDALDISCGELGAEKVLAPCQDKTSCPPNCEHCLLCQESYKDLDQLLRKINDD